MVGHEGHDLRGGPFYNLILKYFACLTCKTVDLADSRKVEMMSDWTEADYWENLDWIEGENADYIRGF